MKKFWIFGLLILFIGVLDLSSTFSYAQGELGSYRIDTSFLLIEDASEFGVQNDIDNIDINLPADSWTISDIDLNFSDIRIEKEIRTIEDTESGYKVIDKHHDGYAVQISLEDAALIYGVNLYIENASKIIKPEDNVPIYIQIRGFDNLTKTPNNTQFGFSAILNMSDTNLTGWYTQIFPSPIYLTTGDYFLTFDGFEIGTSPKPVYHWYYNDINPNHPELYISNYINGIWQNGIQGEPFLYELLQTENLTVYPEEVNMTASIDGNFYKVNNGQNKGKGHLKKADINYTPGIQKVSIPIINNRTDFLKFNLDYKIKMKKLLSSPASVLIHSDSPNEWIVSPAINDITSNQVIQFSYPKSWEDITIFRDGVDITQNVTVKPFERLLIVPDDVIIAEAEWKITAKSYQVPISLNVPKTEFYVGQELQFSIGSPTLPGKYIIIIYNPLNIEEFRVEKTFPTDTNKISFVLPENVEVGNYQAFIYWSNGTDAGIAHSSFIVKASQSNGSLDLTPFYIVGFIILIGSAISVSSYVTIKRVVSKKREQLSEILEKCRDILNLKYIIIVDNKSGVDIYSKSFTEKKLDPSLIAGFLQAIKRFGGEVLEDTKNSRIIKLEYEGSIIIMAEFVNLQLITILKSPPSKSFLYSIYDLGLEIYEKYGNLIEKFEGILSPFKNIEELIEKHFHTSLAYPLKINYMNKIKLDNDEEELLKRAKKFMESQNFNYFYSVYLLPENECKPKDFEVMVNLIKKSVFIPIKDINLD